MLGCGLDKAVRAAGHPGTRALQTVLAFAALKLSVNRLFSPMVIKVDFDLAMTVPAYNLLRLPAMDLPPGYRHLTAQSLHERILRTAGDVTLAPGTCTVSLKKKRDLPAPLEALQTTGTPRVPWLGNRRLVINGASRS